MRTVQRVEDILVLAQVIVAGLAIGMVVGLAAHVVIADPTLLVGAAPAYAELAPSTDVSAPDTGRAGDQSSADGSEASWLQEESKIEQYERARYYYASLGRRDPFAALVGGEFQTDGAVGLPDVADLKLVGIAWDSADRFAMAEDSRGFGYVLRMGDKVRGGKVAQIRKDSVTFAQYTAGELSTITLELPIREDS
jgi:hypothetical protein